MIHRHARDHVLSIWSAGCSSGEEPYNISMILMDYLGSSAAHRDTRVLATDISQRVLSAAQKGTYDLPADFPSSWKQKYFVKENNSSLYTVAPAIRKNVIFRTFNLMDPIQFRLKFDCHLLPQCHDLFRSAHKRCTCTALLQRSLHGWLSADWSLRNGK